MTVKELKAELISQIEQIEYPELIMALQKILAYRAQEDTWTPAMHAQGQESIRAYEAGEMTFRPWSEVKDNLKTRK